MLLNYIEGDNDWFLSNANLNHLKSTQTGNIGGKMIPKLGNFMNFCQILIISWECNAKGENIEGKLFISIQCFLLKDLPPRHNQQLFRNQ